MDQDSRWFEIVLPKDDDSDLWPVLAALESASLEAARQFGYKIFVEAEGRHGTGKISRDSVAELESALARNGFKPIGIKVHIKHLNFGVGPDESYWRTGGFQWVDIAYPWGYPVADEDFGIRVDIGRGAEVEVNGVFTMLQNAAQAALHTRPTSEPVSVVTPPPPVKVSWSVRQWRRFTTHPMWVQIIGGVIASALFALITILVVRLT
ncbi:MAG: hypothetical protein QOD39_3187 [Mycobacterium sp.]|jgi:hypothetical protein|nr:hypothetical protein [Mycobacterium sp.]